MNNADTSRFLGAILFFVCMTVLNADAVELSTESQQIYEQKVKPFLKEYCINCHGSEDNKAGLRLDLLGSDFLDGKTSNVWKEIIDKLAVGSMPPRKKANLPRPSAAESFVVVEWVNQEMRSAEKRAANLGGRVAMRRTNRSEYASFTISRDGGLELAATYNILVIDDVSSDDAFQDQQ